MCYHLFDRSANDFFTELLLCKGLIHFFSSDNFSLLCSNKLSFLFDCHVRSSLLVVFSVWLLSLLFVVKFLCRVFV